ncbi:MAG TPA: GxxExxY protein [Tepidisphaeraceae bacterium]|nr:GxxExxY protein [Tepidisphaeraceae bacterium]
MILEEELTQQIIGAAIEVHREVGPGLLESAYQAFLIHELVQRGLRVRVQEALPVRYKGVEVECGFRIDLIVNDVVLIELKAVEKLAPIHEAQLITYLKLSGIRVGLLINFNVEVLKQRIKRRVV